MGLWVVTDKVIGRRREAGADGTPRNEGSKSFEMSVTRLQLSAYGVGEPEMMSRQVL